LVSIDDFCQALTKKDEWYGNHDNAEGVDTGEGTIIRMQPDF